jgi:aerobic-type carbon monoxide dehydrogenase small subunit (CoxS/CutS family)
MNVEMTVNGKKVKADTSPSLLLSDFLRENLNLTGTHVGCDTSQCGACVVHIDGVSMKSCTLLAVSVDGKSVTTIEGPRQDRQCRSASDAAGLPPQSRPAVRLLHARHDHERGRFCQADAESN